MGGRWDEEPGDHFYACKAQAAAARASYLLYLHAAGSRQGGCAWYDSSKTECAVPHHICRDKGVDLTAEYGCKVYFNDYEVIQLTESTESTRDRDSGSNLISSWLVLFVAFFFT